MFRPEVPPHRLVFRISFVRSVLLRNLLSLGIFVEHLAGGAHAEGGVLSKGRVLPCSYINVIVSDCRDVVSGMTATPLFGTAGTSVTGSTTSLFGAAGRLFIGKMQHHVLGRRTITITRDATRLTASVSLSHKNHTSCSYGTLEERVKLPVIHIAWSTNWSTFVSYSPLRYLYYNVLLRRKYVA